MESWCDLYLYCVLGALVYRWTSDTEHGALAVFRTLNITKCQFLSLYKLLQVHLDPY